MHVRVYNYNTLERVHQYEAHSDYLRCIAVHPTQPFLLTSSGEYTIYVKSVCSIFCELVQHFSMVTLDSTFTL